MPPSDLPAYPYEQIRCPERQAEFSNRQRTIFTFIPFLTPRPRQTPFSGVPLKAAGPNPSARTNWALNSLNSFLALVTNRAARSDFFIMMLNFDQPFGANWANWTRVTFGANRALGANFFVDMTNCRFPLGTGKTSCPPRSLIF